jgi:hypothetical protein
MTVTHRFASEITHTSEVMFVPHIPHRIKNGPTNTQRSYTTIILRPHSNTQRLHRNNPETTQVSNMSKQVCTQTRFRLYLKDTPSSSTRAKPTLLKLVFFTKKSTCPRSHLNIATLIQHIIYGAELGE